MDDIELGRYGKRGDILVFLSRERDIRELAKLLRRRTDLDVLPLYARLSAPAVPGRPNRSEVPSLMHEQHKPGRRVAPEIVFPAELPVVEQREVISEAILGNQVVIIAGETGSGKTTQLPKICLQLGRGLDRQIGHTQPRRLAARTVANRRG